MDELILAVFKALQTGASVEQIHQAIIEKGWAEEDVFLGIQAGLNLFNAVTKQELELASRAPPFGRK